MKRLIYIASPYRLGHMVKNVAVQMDAAHRLLNIGAVPYAPLLIHYLDLYSPRDESDWLEMELEMVMRCDAVLRLPGVSVGADAEVRLAESLDIPVFRGWEELSAWLLGLTECD